MGSARRSYIVSRRKNSHAGKTAGKPASPRQRAIEPIQSLEQRVMFSTAPIVSVSWEGHTVKAYQGEYVADTLNQGAFEKLATRDNFTNVKYLGLNGFYSFDSSLPISQMQTLTRDVKTFKVLQPNEVKYAQTTMPNDPQVINQYGLINTGQLEAYDYNGDGVVTPYNIVQNPTPPAVVTFPSPPYPNENQVGTPGADIQASSAWDITTGSKSVVVAVLDSGIDLNNADLTPNVWVNPLDTAANGFDGDGYPGDVNGWNFVANSSNVQDDFGHGTAVAGVIGAAGNNGIGVTGVNWNVSLMTVKVIDNTGAVSDANEIAGYNYVIALKDRGINIVVMNESLGGDTFPYDVLSADALLQVNKAGILDVASAGNSSENLDATTGTPGKFSLNSPNLITVAAVDNKFQLASFSSYGATSVQLAAPGVDIYTTAPTTDLPVFDSVAMESDIPQFTAAPFTTPPAAANYGYLSGTSLSAPFVTGIIALEAAANPSASPAQLKKALLDGVTFDPALTQQNGLPNLVATAGVANAFKAVQNILNDFVSSNTAHQGTWTNFYGSQGAYVVGESTAYPSFVNVNTAAGAPVILSNDTKNLAALQRVSDSASRISAYESSATSETINLHFTDGLVHQTSIYLADLDHKKRVETVAILDGATGALLNAQTISNFTKGEYLTWDLRGNVTIEVVNDAGPTAVYSGVFFDAPSTTPTTVAGTDTTTGGYNWRNQYGSQGAVVVGNTSQLPGYVSLLNVVGENGVVLKSSTRKATALQKVSDVNTGVQAYWSSATHFDVNVGINDGLVHVVTLYVADFDHKQRQERIQVLGSPSGALLASEDVSNFNNGEFLSFRILGSATFRITDTAGPSAVLSGVFFDAAFGENSHFVAIDTTTHGNWQNSQYGLTSAYIVADNFPGIDDPANPSITQVGGIEGAVSGNSGNPAALSRTAVPTQRVAAYLYTPTSMTIDYNPGDLAQHTVALYFADYQNDHRVESVTLYNGNTNMVLSHQIISNFSKGKYLVFDLTGPILITINSGAYPNAVLSGIFTN